jgi:hypothetical protein
MVYLGAIESFFATAQSMQCLATDETIRELRLDSYQRKEIFSSQGAVLWALLSFLSNGCQKLSPMVKQLPCLPSRVVLN